ncbi:MAG: putative metal-binding motif-containing protein, partial [Candidatus Thorarchaeota archaeon]
FVGTWYWAGMEYGNAIRAFNDLPDDYFYYYIFSNICTDGTVYTIAERVDAPSDNFVITAAPDEYRLVDAYMHNDNWENVIPLHDLTVSGLGTSCIDNSNIREEGSSQEIYMKNQESESWVFYRLGVTNSEYDSTRWHSHEEGHISPQLEVINDNLRKSFFNFENGAEAEVTSDMNVHVGLMPEFWRGLIEVYEDSIWIYTMTGHWKWFFPTQDYSQIKHEDMPYRLHTSSGELVEEGLLYGGNPYYSPWGKRIDTLGEGEYILEIDRTYTIGDFDYTGMVRYEFVSTNDYTSLPFMDSMKLTCDGEPCQILKADTEKILSFDVQSGHGVLEFVNLYFEHQGTWANFPLGQTGDHYEGAFLSLGDLEVKFKIVLIDNSGNSMEYIFTIPTRESSRPQSKIENFGEEFTGYLDVFVEKMASNVARNSLEEGQREVMTIGEYEYDVTFVSSNGNSADFEINGETLTMVNQGESRVLADESTLTVLYVDVGENETYIVEFIIEHPEVEWVIVDKVVDHEAVAVPGVGMAGNPVKLDVGEPNYFNFQDVRIQEAGQYRVHGKLRGANGAVLTSTSGPMDEFWNFQVNDCTDLDGDGYSPDLEDCGEIDCNDEDSSINPGADEICDDADNDCDGAVNEENVCGGTASSCSSGVYAPGTVAESICMGDECEAVAEGKSQTLDLKGSLVTNLISFHILPEDRDVESVVAPIADNLYLVQDDEGNVYTPPNVVFEGHPGTNTIGDIRPEKGYYIKVYEDDTLTVAGDLVDSNVRTKLIMNRSHKIGYPFDYEQPLTNVMASILDKIMLMKSASGELYYPPGYLTPDHPGTNTIGNMKPGEGYHITVTEDVVFDFGTITCGNGVCDKGETIATCATDCAIKDPPPTVKKGSRVIGASSIDTNLELAKVKVDGSSYDNTELKGKKVVRITETVEAEDGGKVEEVKVAFEHNFDEAPLDFTKAEFEEQTEDALEGMMIVKGIDLTGQDTTKTMYVDKLVDGTHLCVKDVPFTDSTTFSENCDGPDEELIDCSVPNKYDCAIEDGKFVVSNLKHSGAKEQTYYCGDNLCRHESCSNCPEDCGKCSEPDPGNIPSGSRGTDTHRDTSNRPDLVPSTGTGDFVPDTTQRSATTPSNTNTEPNPEQGGVIEHIKVDADLKEETKVQVGAIAGVAVLIAVLIFLIVLGIVKVKKTHLDPKTRYLHTLERYVKSQKDRGYSESEIKDRVKEAGWSKEYVKQVFRK